MELSLIDATLKYGRFKYLSRKSIILEILSWVLPSIVLYAAAILSYIIVDENKYTYILLFTIVPTVLLGVEFIRLKSLNGRIKEMQLWLQDAVEINAVTSSAGECVSSAAFVPLYKLQVDFDYNGQHYTFLSKNEYKIKLGSPPTGFHKIWERYINKNVKIMYSHKYEEVMLVKGSAKDFLKPLLKK